MPSNPNQTRNKPRRGPPRPTTARGPHAGLAISLAFHAGLIAATYMTWSHVVVPPEETHAVPVDLITIAKETNIAPQAPPPDKVQAPTPTVEQPALPQFSEVEPAPEPPVPQFKVKPDKTDTDQPDKPDKAKAQDFAALLNKLAAPAAPPKNAKTAARTVQGVGAQNMMTADLADALQSQIQKCWSPPVGAPNAADLVVDLDLRLNRDGSVAALQLAPGVNTGNPYTRAAAEAARRAIYECQPYRLPADRYSDWSEINPFHFDPRAMMNQ
jgi:hypothetical protein